MQKHDCTGGFNPSEVVVTVRTDRGLDAVMMVPGSEEPMPVPTDVRWVEVLNDVPVRCPICLVPIGHWCDRVTHLEL